MPIVRNVNIIPKIVPKFVMPKYSLIIGARIGANPPSPKPKKMTNIMIVIEEPLPMMENRNKPILVKTPEAANTYFFGKMSDSHP